MKRREVIKGLSILPIASVIGNSSLEYAFPAADLGSIIAPERSIYESIGVRPLINARGTVTVVGASRIPPEVQKAMGDAVRQGYGGIKNDLLGTLTINYVIQYVIVLILFSFQIINYQFIKRNMNQIK